MCQDRFLYALASVLVGGVVGLWRAGGGFGSGVS
jgi:hypothetical protein